VNDTPYRDALGAPEPASPDDRRRRTAVGEARPGDMPLAGGKKLQVSVISPHEVGFEGEADGIIAPAHDGMLGILYGHAPMVVLLGEGELIVRRHWQHDLRFHVSRGFLQVVDNQVSVLAEEVRPLADMPRLDPDELEG
jgi:F-type H+-transporting ATPase subunit epsilon